MQLYLPDCEIERMNARQKYCQLKRNAKHSRALFLQELATQQAAQGNETVSDAILRLTRNDEVRSSYGRIKSATKLSLGATDKLLTGIDSESGSK